MLSFYGSIFSFISICSFVFFIYFTQDSWAFREGLAVYKNPHGDFGLSTLLYCLIKDELYK